jgi:tetratricopeptide (TPR) repeat protein
MAHYGTRYVEAAERLEEAATIYERIGEPRLHAAASAVLGEAEWYGMDKIEEPLRRMAAAYEVLSAEGADATVAALAHEIARFHYFAGHVEDARSWIERSLQIAESLWLPDVLSNALNTKSLILRDQHPEEAMALLSWSLRIAEEHDLTDPLIRAVNNLGVSLSELDRYDEALATFERQMEVSRRLGMRQSELVGMSSSMSLWVDVGRWDEALEAGDRLFAEIGSAARDVSELLKLTVIHVARGDLSRGREVVEAFGSFAASEEAQMRAAYDTYLALQLLTEGEVEQALASAQRAIDVTDVVGLNTDSTKWAFVLGLSAAAALGDLDRLQRTIATIEAIPPGVRSPMYEAQVTRFKARLAAASDGDPEPSFKSAVGLFRELGTPFSLAITLFEQGDCLSLQGRQAEAESLLVEARALFEELRAVAWIERVDAVAGARSAVG